MKNKKIDKEIEYSGSIHETAGGTPRPSLFRNYISYFGLAIVGASVTSFVLLMLIELTTPSENPYTALITFIAVPTIVLVGLFLTGVGLLWERRRRVKDDRGPDGGVSGDRS